MKRRKFTSIFVCLCLFLTVIPAAAFAAESEPAGDTQQTVPSQETTVQPQQESTAPVQPETAAPAVVEPSEPSTAPETAPTIEPEPQKATEEPQAQPQQEPQAEPAPTAEKEKAQKAAVPPEKASKASAAPAEKKEAAPTQTVATVKKTDSGIKVTGGVEGKDWEYDPAGQTLTIKKDGMTVSGTAADNLAILCSLAVTTITMDGLDHGNNMVVMSSENDRFDITLKGNNKIDMILGAGDVTIKGTKNSSLDVSTMITAFRDLSLKDATVNSPFLVAMRDINITGKSVVTAKSTELSKELEQIIGGDGSPFARITAVRDININLATGGRVTSIGTKEILPMMAGNKINLGKGSKVVTPNGGKVGTLEIDGFPAQVILDANGNPATDAVIKNGTVLTASATATDASVISPQTGDNSMDRVMWAFVLAALAAAVLAALVFERRRHNQ